MLSMFAWNLSPAALRWAEITLNPLVGTESQDSPHHNDAEHTKRAKFDTFTMPVSWKENIIDVTKIIEKRANAIPYVTTLFFFFF